MTLDDAETLLALPERWSALDEPELIEFLLAAFVASAVNCDPNQEAACNALYEHALGVLLPYQRADLVVRLQELLERVGRHYGRTPVDALKPFVLNDADITVVSTAALAAAQVIHRPQEDLAGPRFILKSALAQTDGERQTAILAGLVALGDARVFALIDQAWASFPEGVQSDVLQVMGSHPPTLAAIDFLVSRVERGAAQGSEGPIGQVVASLVWLGEAAHDAENPYTNGSGVREIERRFPSWSVPESENPIQVVQFHPIAEVRRRIARVLTPIAAAESYPRLIPIALRAWGVEDEPFVSAVKGAVITSGLDQGEARLLDTPVSIEPMPDWDRDDAVVEWGILNPFGPTKVQLCLVPLNAHTSALVYVMHNPFSHVSLLAGTVNRGDRGDVRRKLLALAGRFQLGEHELLASLPQWVNTFEESGFDEQSDGAAFFRTLHQGALVRKVGIDVDVDEAADSLKRLAVNPMREVNHLLTEAIAQAGGSGARRRRRPRRAARGDAYIRWFRIASAPDHVAAVSQTFLSCWNTAERFQHGVEAAS